MRFSFNLYIYIYFALSSLNSKFRNIVKELLLTHHLVNFEQKVSNNFLNYFGSIGVRICKHYKCV